MGRNSELNRARVGKNDEFYTDLYRYVGCRKGDDLS